MNAFTRRVTAAAVALAAPAMIAVGAASAAHADTYDPHPAITSQEHRGPNFYAPTTRAHPWQPVYGGFYYYW